jgi:hypothetical protein
MAVHTQMANWLPALLVASLAGGIDMQAVSAQPPDGGKEPAMVRFYGVGPMGMSAPENPLATGFALDSSASFDPAARDSGAAAQPDEAPDPGLNLIENPAPLTTRLEYPSQRHRDFFRREFDEYRCERHGFVYTKKGRCVVPVWRHTTRLPRNRPGPRVENRELTGNRPRFSGH